MRLLTCSSSGPRLEQTSEGVKSLPATPGGLVPLVSALLEEVGGHWIYGGPADSTRNVTLGSAGGRNSITWQSLGIDATVMARQHEFINIRLLLWTFHYLHDTSEAPVFDGATTSYWGEYEWVNRHFAAALERAHVDHHNELVIVQDFQLMLVPGYFAASTPTRSSTLAYFHHIPWCEPDYFGILPRWMITRILESLLACDFVGFHCDRWGDAFLDCCERYLSDSRIVDRTVYYRDHVTRVTTAPGPIDARALDDLMNWDQTEYIREDLLRRAGGRRILARVDRMDLWKNVARGLLAYELLLQRRPRLASEVWFCAIVAPTRVQTERHKHYQTVCDDIARRINERDGQPAEAVSMIYPDDQSRGRERSVAALSIADVTLANPTFDGLSLVAKEAVVVNPASRLLLSTNAGAFSQLRREAIPVPPFDVLVTADVIGDALDSARTARSHAGSLAANLRQESGRAWVSQIVGSSVS